MSTFFVTVTGLLLISYLSINLVHLAGTVLAGRNLLTYSHTMRSAPSHELLASPLMPGVSIVVPSDDRTEGLLDTIGSLLALHYPRHEIIVVDTGSAGDTAARIRNEFTLIPARRALRTLLPTAPVAQSWISTRHPNLWVLRKEHTDRADALNTGVSAARYPYVLSVDAGTMLEPDALLEAARPLSAEPDMVIGAGEILQAISGSRLRHGRIRTVRLTHNPVTGLPVVEYLRTFLLVRMFWAGLNGLPVASGAFAMFHRSLIEEVGGWTVEAVTGDHVEIMLDLQRSRLERRQPYRIDLIREPVRRAQLPRAFPDLLRHWRRWHGGTAEAVWRHRDAIGRRRHGRFGRFALPALMVELLAPSLELLGWLLVLVGWALGQLPTALFVAFLAAAVLTNVVLSVTALALAQIGYQRHPHRGDVLRLIGYGLLEAIGYRQLLGIACTLGIIDFLRSHPGDRYRGPGPRPRGAFRTGTQPSTAGEVTARGLGR